MTCNNKFKILIILKYKKVILVRKWYPAFRKWNKILYKISFNKTFSMVKLLKKTIKFCYSRWIEKRFSMMSFRNAFPLTNCRNAFSLTIQIKWKCSFILLSTLVFITDRLRIWFHYNITFDLEGVGGKTRDEILG